VRLACVLLWSIPACCGLAVLSDEHPAVTPAGGGACQGVPLPDLTTAVQTAVKLAFLFPRVEKQMSEGLDRVNQAEAAGDERALWWAVFNLELLCLRVWRDHQPGVTRGLNVSRI